MLVKLLAVFWLLALHHMAAGRHIDDGQSPQTDQGLYDSTDDVLVLNNATFTSSIFRQNHATIVEFYNSFCGFCRKYAPSWKAFAADVIAWQSVVQVAAVNCAADENNNLCRKYEVMAYPSLRYFPAHFDDPNTWGIPVQSHHESDKLRSSLIELLRNETAAHPVNWATLLSPVQDHSKGNLFDQLSDDVKYIILLYIPGNGTLPNEVALDFIANPNIAVKWVNTGDAASNFGLSTENFLTAIGRSSKVIPMSATTVDRRAVLEAIRVFLNEKNLNYVLSTTAGNRKETHLQNQSNIEMVANVDRVYLKDIQNAAWYSLNHEVTQFSVISGERLKALKRYINILKRYLLFGESGNEFLLELDSYAADKIEIDGGHFRTKLQQLRSKWTGINVTNNWIGCQGSSSNLRGYSCGLWELFHFLTVQSKVDPNSSDPLDALRAVHGFVKNFFGCTDCSQHFQGMADELLIWQVASKDEAVLWLWKAHNQVNRRLAGDATEDPAYPKIQFPSKSVCPRCRDDSSDWQMPEVLHFLSEYYGVANLSRADENELNVPRAEKRILDNVFSEMDMRMGIVLYVFCIGMMVVAVKLLVRRGYRRKLYSYDYKV